MPALTDIEATELFRQPPDDYIGCDTGEIAYRRVGSGPDVLFVPGWPVSGATFRSLLPHLVDHVTCHLIDMPGMGSSRFADDALLTITSQMEAVTTVVDQLGFESVAVVGNDSGGLISRHVLAGDNRLRAMGLIGTEQPQGLSARFKFFLAPRNLPGFGATLGWVTGKPRIRRHALLFGDAFHDRDVIDGEFDEFFLAPLNSEPRRLKAAMKLLKSFDAAHVEQLGEIHQRIDVPVRLVWGENDKFFPVDLAREMVGTFPNADIVVIPEAGLFVHEEQPDQVAEALLGVLK